jgi:Rieske Fe-S protein
MSHEDQPGNDPFGVYQEEEPGALTSAPATLNVDHGASVIPPNATTQSEAPTELLHTSAAFPTHVEGYPDATDVVDPLGLWAVTSGRPLTSSPTPGTSTLRPPVRQSKSDSNARLQPERHDRRKFVKLLVVGAAGLVTAVTVGGVSFARAPHSMTQSPSRIEDDRSEGSTSIEAHRERDDGDWRRSGRRPHKTPAPSQSPTPRPSPSPTQTATPQPTQTATPTPQPTMPPTPTGTVIGSTTQATNSVVSFTNPADGQASWLVHMSNGNFVAVEQACTHAGCPVKYNASTGQFNCPCHGAIFNADGTNPQAPATRPLPPVHITVNANGTITMP